MNINKQVEMRYKDLFADKLFSKDYLVKVRLTFLMTVCVFSTVFANTYAQKIDINLKNASLKQVLNNLEKQTGYYFLYDNGLLEGKSSMDLSLSNVEFKEVLNQITEKNSLEYKIVDNTVTVYSKTANSQPEQEMLVTGVVKTVDSFSDKPLPMPGIIVNVKGTNKVATTNNNGQFTIKVTKNAVLVFSFLGFEKQEITVNNVGPYNVVLVESADLLKEVVVTGYNTKEAKENQVGSAYTVTAKELEMRPVDRIDKILEGMVPGLTVQSQDNSNASSRPRFATRIRGESSMGYGTSSNEPLWIIDGVPIYTGGTTNMIPGVEVSVSPLSYLNPEDIESITVLKDASSTTIYGANAANGVILITTKKGNNGREGSPVISYNFRTGINTVTNSLKMLNSEQYQGVLSEMGYLSAPTDVDTDWSKVYYRTGQNQNHNLSMSGRTDKNRYYISLGYYNEKPITIANKTKRISTRANYEQNIGKRLTFGLNTESSYNINDMFNTGSFYTLRPTINPYNADGSYALRDEQGNRLFPSLAEAYQNDYYQKTFANYTNSRLSLQIINGLTFKTSNGVTFTSTIEDEYRSPDNLSGKSDNGYSRRSDVNMLRWISSNTLNYSKKLFEGDLDIIVGSEAQQTIEKAVSVSGTNFPNSWIKEPSLAPEAYRRGITGSSDQTTMSYLGKLNYVWKSRYALTYSIRRDGDSNFGSDVRWANFQAAGLAWTLSSEPFWKSEIIDFAKLKASYGTNGNSRFGVTSARGVYSFSDKYTYGAEGGAVMTGGLNNSLKWETTRMLNLGVDMRVLKRFSLGVEYYLNRTHDLINNAAVSMTSGQRKIFMNIGKLENRGVEIVLNTNNIEKSDFYWNTSLIFSLNRSKILELAEGIDRVYGTNILRVGEDSKAFYMVRWAGVDPSTGKPMWYDANGNITFTYSADNRVITGSPTPDFYGSLSNQFAYKRFSLSVQLLYNMGGKEFSQILRNATNDGISVLDKNQPVDILNHWKQPGDLAINPLLTKISNSSAMNSTRYLMDKTYIKLHNVSLRYELSEHLLKRIQLSRAAVYLQGDNLGIWTPYKNRSDVNNYSTLYSTVPVQRVISFGLNVSL